MTWPRWRYILPLRLRSLFLRNTVEQELSEELRFHLECRVEEELSRGVDARQAKYRALRAIGGLEQRKEEIRDMRRVNWFSDFAADLRYALRALGQSKLFTSLVVLTLGLGIGANSAIFSFIDALLLRPLPVLRPSEVVTVSSFTPNSSAETVGPLSYPDYLDYRDKTKCFDGLAAFTDVNSFGFTTRAGEPAKLKGGILVSGNLFRVMGVEPQLGRDFSPAEDSVPGRDAVVVLGHDFWQSQFGADPSVIGRRILLDGIHFSIIGVAPQKFSGMDQYLKPDFFVPLMMWPRLNAASNGNPLNDRGRRELMVKGRLRPGVPISQARAEANLIAGNLRRAFPKTDENRQFAVRTEFALRVAIDPTDAALSGVLLALSATVFLIACANVAGLLIGRARTRSREIAVRLAIGAGRFRLVRLLLTESLLISLMGGAVGIALGYGGAAFFSRFTIPTDLPIGISVHLDRRVLFVSLAASLLSAVVCGLVPALQTTRTNLVRALKTADIEIPGKHRFWGRNMLVVCQIAASLALLTGALLMVRSFQEKWRNGPGFRTDHLLTMSFDPQLVRYTAPQTAHFYDELIRRVRMLPGVRNAALTGSLPMAGGENSLSVIPEGYQMPKGKDDFPIQMATAGDRYFQTFGVELMQGRAFNDTDTATSTKVAVVNQEFAHHYWPNASALGKRFRIDSANRPLIQIVGIAKTGKYDWIGEAPTEFVYLPFAQHSRTAMTLLVQTEGPSQASISAVRGLAQNLDPNQPIFDVLTIEDYYHRRVVMAPVMVTQAVSAMGIIGLILAMAGLYGLIAQAASRRTREIGIRMAIGATSANVLRMVLRQAVLLVAIGLCIGLIFAFAVEKGLNAVFQVSGIDIGAYLLILPALVFVTMLAAFIPARKASRIEPTRALRYE